jgi:CheY-like chemotaxis protein
LQSHPITREIPVIAVSANAMGEDIDFALKLGFSDYLTKPFDVMQFQQAINFWLSKDK